MFSLNSRLTASFKELFQSFMFEAEYHLSIVTRYVTGCCIFFTHNASHQRLAEGQSDCMRLLNEAAKAAEDQIVDTPQ